MKNYAEDFNLYLVNEKKSSNNTMQMFIVMVKRLASMIGMPLTMC